MDVETVVRRGQFPARPPVLGAVDRFLPVLNAHTHGEGLALHRYAHLMQPPEAVPRRVADGEDQVAAGERLGPAGVGDPCADQCIAFGDKPVQPGLKTDFPAEGDDFLSDILHHADQHVGADVGLCVVDDGLRRAVGGELLQHPEHPPVVGAGVELAVGEGAGAALAELDVGLRVQCPAFAESFNCGGALFGLLPAFEHDRLRPGFCQQQSRKHARRAEADDDGTLVHIDRRNLIDRRRIGRGVLSGFLHRPFFSVFKRHGGGAGIVNVVFPPRVEGALDRTAVRDLALRYAELFCGLLAKHVQRLVRFEPEISEQDHVPSLPARRPLAQAHCRL